MVRSNIARRRALTASTRPKRAYKTLRARNPRGQDSSRLEPPYGGRSTAAKQVVYLWGSGATQAEATYRGAQDINLLMADNDIGYGVATRILQRIPRKWRSSFSTDQGTDIEKLISLLAASNVAEYELLASQLRGLYLADICKGLASAKILDRPTLATGLFEMHNIESMKRYEVLSGVITTNHDGLLQVAAQSVYGQVDIGIPFSSDDLNPTAHTASPILQLHGSFTWAFGLPINVSSLRDISTERLPTVWIPPAILKESKTYPFNKIAGLAYELLSKHCDVLRIAGASLAQNDWNVVSMLFNAQRHMELEKKAAFRVELIMPPESGGVITQSCSYLRNLTPIGQLTDGSFADFNDADALTSDMKNPLFYWLKEKIQFHRRRGDFGPGAVPPAMAQIVGDRP